MQFEYHAFDVAPYLESSTQPSFALPGLIPAATYYTLTNPDTGAYSMIRGGAEVVRIPVFGVATQPPDPNSTMRAAGHGSLLVALGLELALKFTNQLQLTQPISRVVVLVATRCHTLPEARYRAYLGLALEVGVS